MTRTPTLLAVLALLAACGGGNDNLPPPPPPPVAPPATLATTQPAAQGPSNATAPEAPPPAVALVPGVASPDPTSPPTVRFAAPAKGANLTADKAGATPVKFDVKNWATAPGGAHLHIVLDGSVVKEVTDPKAPLKLGDLTDGNALAEGQHALVVFAVNANDEAVKTPGAVATVEFFIGKVKTRSVELGKPLLVYNRPSGELAGNAANHVLIDFLVLNDKPAEGKDHVHVTVTGPGIDASKPAFAEATKSGATLYLDNLQNGSYQIKVELVGSDHKPIAGAWNSVTRTVTIRHES